MSKPSAISKPKTFLAINFGCRVNAAETNQWSQLLVDQGYLPNPDNPNIILVNTCAVTKKGEYESIYQIKKLSQNFPEATIIATGCADLTKINHLSNIRIYSNIDKESWLLSLKSDYTTAIKDKFSHTNRFLLKVQSGCIANCSYCTVPLKRPYLWSLSIIDAITTAKQAISGGYQEIIITGVNLNQYQPGFSNLLETLLVQTTIPLISFGSIPLLCLDNQFIRLFKKYPKRLSHFLHIPIQSGSDKVLKLMNRPYTRQNIISKINDLRSTIQGFQFGTDIIVGFPDETDDDFQETYNLCQQIGFSKIHTFRFSPRPHTTGLILFNNHPKVSQKTKQYRSSKIRSLVLKSN